jgi:hypothetical protein
MSVVGLCPVPPLASKHANRFSPEVLAAAECMRQLALRHPGRIFAVPYLAVTRPDGSHYYSARVLEYRVDPTDWINYYDTLILNTVASCGCREEVEREVRKRKPPLADRIMEAQCVLGWADTARVYTATLEYLEESGYLKLAFPELLEQVRAALTLGRLL